MTGCQNVVDGVAENYGQSITDSYRLPSYFFNHEKLIKAVRSWGLFTNELLPQHVEDEAQKSIPHTIFLAGERTNQLNQCGDCSDTDPPPF